MYRPQWSGLATTDDAARAVELLEELGFLRAVRVEARETGGRPKTIYHVNPRLDK